MTNAEFFDFYERTSDKAFKAAYLVLGDTEAACEAMTKAYAKSEGEGVFYRALCRYVCRSALLRRLTAAPVERDPVVRDMARLSVTERRIIVMRTVLGMTDRDIKAELRLPSPIFRLLHKSAYRKLSQSRGRNAG